MPRTLLEMSTLINQELDLETEDFIQPTELVGYFNHAIAEAYAHILKLGLKDKYFKKKSTISLVLDQDIYALPADIYADKIIKIVYRSGTTIYEVKPIDSEHMYEDEELVDISPSTGYYRYDVVRGTDGLTQLQIWPKSQETTADAFKIHYYRDTNTLVNETDICDLPEISYEFIHARVKVFCYAKEPGHPNMPLAQADLEKMQALMIATLEQQLVDSEYSKMNLDMSHYEEST
jgi:hypothetical protein